MRVSLDDLKPGMTLAADLQEPGGRLLLPAATVLTDRHLRYFQMWGVSEADIESDGSETPVNEADAADPAIVAEAEANMASLFRHADTNHPVVSQVLRHCVNREIRRLVARGVSRHG
jgi:hypothetical protein